MKAFFERVLSEQSGSTVLVEFALTLPVIMTLGFGLFEFSKVFIVHQVITTGVRDAARYVARQSNPEGSIQAAKNLAATGSPSGGSERISGWGPDTVEVLFRFEDNGTDPNTDGPLYRGPNQIRLVIVTISRQHELLPILGVGAFTLAASHSERVIGE